MIVFPLIRSVGLKAATASYAPVWWYVGLLAIGMVPLIAAAVGWLSRPALTASAAALALAALLGLLRIGLLLLPSVIGVIVAASVLKPVSR